MDQKALKRLKSVFPEFAPQFLTIYRLYACNVVFVQREVVSVGPRVEGGHDGVGVIGVLQSQSVAQLVDGNQEEVDTWRLHSDTHT